MRTTTNRGADPRSTSRRLRRAAASLGAVTAIAMGVAMPAAAAPEVGDGPTAASWGAAWLDGQLDAGIPLETFGSPDWGTTLEAALALASVEGNEARLAQLWQSVQDAREDVVTAGGADVPGRLAQVVLLAVALGEDPGSVGDAPGDDLVARLAATRTAAGADEGLFGTQSPAYDGAYRQGLSLAALVAAGATPDQSSVDWLVDQQCDDGSWMPYRADLGAPCVFDPDAFLGPDSNSTGFAVAGLVAAGDGAAAVAGALDWLDDVQTDDGGWGFFPGDGSDPNSTAVVMLSLRSAGELDDPRFADRDGSSLEVLLSFQLGCATGADAGAFTYPGTGDMANTFATAQGVSAAAGATLGITGPLVPAADDPCPPATTTTTSTTTSSSVPTTSTVVAPTSAAPTSSVPAVQPLGATPVAAAGEGRDGAVAGGSLARTGTGTGAPLGAGLVLVCAGVVLLGSARLRRP